MSVKQWVNIIKNDAYVEDGIDSTNRCGFVQASVKMKNGDPALLKLRVVVEGGDNIEYTDAEKLRNIEFKLLPMSPEVTGTSDAELKQEFALPAAGGNKYKIEAKYKDVVKSSSKVIETIRRLYYQVITMDGIAGPASWGDVEAEFLKHHVELKEREKGSGTNKIPKSKTLSDLSGTFNKAWLKTEAKNSYTATKFWPYAVAAVFVDQSATCTENVKVETVKVRSRLSSFFSSAAPTHVLELKDNTGSPAYLWLGLDDRCDAAPKWWLREVTFDKGDGSGPITVSPSDVHLEGPTRFGAFGYSRLKVVLDPKKFGNLVTANVGTLTVKTNVVKGFQGGYSTVETNTIVVAKRAWWNGSISDGARLQTIVHELGHKIGMASTGNRPKGGLPGDYDFINNKTPDAHAHLYGEYHFGSGANPKGHVGNHCENGMANYNAATNAWSGTPACTMFGGSPTTDAATAKLNYTPLGFCAECAKSLRKMDLNGFHIEALQKGTG